MLKITCQEEIFIIKKWRLMTSKKADLVPLDPFKKIVFNCKTKFGVLD